MLLTTKEQKIFCDLVDDDIDLGFIEIWDEIIEILDPSKSNKYSGNILSTSIECAIQLEFTNRKRIAWACFYMHKKI